MTHDRVLWLKHTTQVLQPYTLDRFIPNISWKSDKRGILRYIPTTFMPETNHASQVGVQALQPDPNLLNLKPKICMLETHIFTILCNDAHVSWQGQYIVLYLRYGNLLAPITNTFCFHGKTHGCDVGWFTFHKVCKSKLDQFRVVTNFNGPHTHMLKHCAHEFEAHVRVCTATHLRAKER